ncbi:MAG: type II toxin-antitoxin system Phd/YefM family antitoxin [Actinobacteria bacterium]|nr:type II toxin-antitoxin system Phd/YefM family antitoxin [Actinomycetota bacterium]
MIIKATELKNNLGKYLMDCLKEDVIITRNGMKIARLSAFKEYMGSEVDFIDGGVVSDAEAAFNLKPRKVSWEEFLRLTENSEKRYEYIDGEVYILTAPRPVHQEILGELHILFYKWFKGKKCRPFLSPFDVRLNRDTEHKNMVEPDLIVICDFKEKLNKKGDYMGIPALVVEILSESTQRKDQVKKFDLYLSTGVSEYWIINPWKREVSVYLFENNNIAESEAYRKNETAKSYFFPGLKIKLKNIFK